MSERTRNILAPQRRKLLAVLLLVGAAWGCVALYRASRTPERFAVVDEGKLYRSAQPSTREIKRLADDLGLKTIIIARSGQSKQVPNEVEFAQSQGLRVVHIPIESEKAIPESQVRQFFDVIDDPRNHPVLVHCSAGRHRTGYLCARYRIDRQGWTVPRAVDELRSFGFDTVDHRAVLDQISKYTPRLAAASQPAATKIGATTHP